MTSISPDEVYDALRKAVGRLLAADRRRRGREQQRRTGTLSHAHLRALFVLTQQKEATAGTLAREADLNPASVTAMIDHLEERGLVERRRDTEDRRVCWISLTDSGHREVEEQERYWRARMAETFADITPKEIAAAVKVLERLATVMDNLSEADEVVRH
jgi:DNA-binding MarR family transcriptional regulator